MFADYFLSTNTLSVVFYHNYILAGIGNILYVYRKKDVILKKRIFNGERIHQIYVEHDDILIKGCKEISFVKLFEVHDVVSCHVVSGIQCRDWILDMFWDKARQLLVVATAHNLVEVWHIGLKSRCLRTYTCEEKCILYCCKIIGTNGENFILLCGTVFSDVIVWVPSLVSQGDQQVLHRLVGHEGVIFSITADPCQNLICTTSDDRSVRIWNVETEGSILDGKNWENAKISLRYTLFGHTARVWKSLILPDFFISTGEDSKLCVWNKSGNLEKLIELHHNSGIRGLTYSSDNKSVITGGEDGGINIIPLNNLKSHITSTARSEFIITDYGYPKKVSYLNLGVCITDRGCVMIAEDQSHMKKIYENKEFANYCILEPSPCKRYFIMGSINGHVVVIEAKSGVVIFNENLIKGKIFSVHWVNDYIIVCGPEGVLTICKARSSPLINFEKKNRFLLPTSKERWTTCALIFKGFLLLGDRMGSIHVYDMTSLDEIPKQTFSKIHGCLGVTDIALVNNAVLTAGRDGTVKKFCLHEGIFIYYLKFKLPTEWPWKIVEHENDTLIIGFNSVNLIVWSMSKREILIKYDCGGGHRSFDFKLSNNLFRIVYIRDKIVHVSEMPILSSIQIRDGFHAKEINSVKMIHSDPVILVSGGEDTTVRFSRIERNRMEQLFNIECHISSVRSLAVISSSKTEKIIFSGGGRGQISVHRFTLDGMKYQEQENIFFSRSGRKMCTPAEEGETRIMWIDCLAKNDGILVFTACSDRQIRIFMFKKSLSQLSTIPYSHCILKVKCIVIEKCIIMLSMASDGHVVLWNVTDIESGPKFYNKIDSIQIHQSGINSFELKDLGKGRFLLATGGDDNLIAITLLDLTYVSYGKVCVIDQWKTSNVHACQITGIAFLGNALFTVSIDQRLTVWKWSIEGKISLKFIDQYLSPVADIQGLEVSQTLSDFALVCVYGEGIEIIEVDLPWLSAV